MDGASLYRGSDSHANLRRVFRLTDHPHSAPSRGPLASVATTAELVLVYGGGTALASHQASPFVGSHAA